MPRIVVGQVIIDVKVNLDGHFHEIDRSKLRARLV